MAATLTYSSLVTAVQEYLERDDNHLVSQIPLFIMLGQRRIAHEFKILGLKIFITDTFAPGIAVLPKPSQWLNNATFNIGINEEGQTTFPTRVQVLQRGYEYCRMYWPNEEAVARPKYYCDYNFYNWLIAPTPDQAYPYEIAYFETPTLIDEVTQSNWVTQNIPEVLLYSTLLETASYLKDDERMQVWMAYYTAAKEAVSKEDQQRLVDNFSVRGL